MEAYAARQTLDVVSANYQRLAEYTRGHGIVAGEATDGVIAADRGILGHGGPLPLPGEQAYP